MANSPTVGSITTQPSLAGMPPILQRELEALRQELYAQKKRIEQLEARVQTLESA